MSDKLSKLRPRGRVTTIDHRITGENESKKIRELIEEFLGNLERRELIVVPI